MPKAYGHGIAPRQRFYAAFRVARETEPPSVFEKEMLFGAANRCV